MICPGARRRGRGGGAKSGSRIGPALRLSPILSNHWVFLDFFPVRGSVMWLCG